MDNNMIVRTVLIILAAFVLFALVNYYNNKQDTVKSEKFYNANTAMNTGSSASTGALAAPTAQRERDQPQGNASQQYASVPNVPATAEQFYGGSSVDSTNSVGPSDPLGDSDFRTVDYQGSKLPSDCFPKDRMTVDDLLPKDAANSKWAQVNPAGQGDVKDQNFLNAGYMFGINTVGSSLKNANLQLRSEPVIPKVSIGPFLNSSYEASDALRRPLEIGGDC